MAPIVEPSPNAQSPIEIQNSGEKSTNSNSLLSSNYAFESMLTADADVNQAVRNLELVCTFVLALCYSDEENERTN